MLQSKTNKRAGTTGPDVSSYALLALKRQLQHDLCNFKLPSAFTLKWVR